VCEIRRCACIPIHTHTYIYTPTPSLTHSLQEQEARAKEIEYREQIRQDKLKKQRAKRLKLANEQRQKQHERVERARAVNEQRLLERKQVSACVSGSSVCYEALLGLIVRVVQFSAFTFT
jgi:hypothetical protein